MKYKLDEQAQASNEASEIGIFLGVFGAITAIPVIAAIIAAWKESRKTPEQRLMDILNYKANHYAYIDIPESFPSMHGLTVEEQIKLWGFNYALDPRKSNPKSTVSDVISLQTYMQMLQKFKAFVSAIASIHDTTGCEKVIDKALKTCFKFNKDIEFSGSAFACFNFVTSTVKWPTDPFYANVESAVNQLVKQLDIASVGYPQLAARINEIINAPTTGCSREELLGRVAYVKICDAIATMHNTLIRSIENNLVKMCDVDVVPISSGYETEYDENW